LSQDNRTEKPEQIFIQDEKQMGNLSEKLQSLNEEREEIL
jgi:hypothetical protein